MSPCDDNNVSMLMSPPPCPVLVLPVLSLFSLQEVQQVEAWPQAEAAPGTLPVGDIVSDDVVLCPPGVFIEPSQFWYRRQTAVL